MGKIGKLLFAALCQIFTDTLYICFLHLSAGCSGFGDGICGLQKWCSHYTEKGRSLNLQLEDWMLEIKHQMIRLYHDWGMGFGFVMAISISWHMQCNLSSVLRNAKDVALESVFQREQTAYAKDLRQERSLCVKETERCSCAWNFSEWEWWCGKWRPATQSGRFL